MRHLIAAIVLSAFVLPIAATRQPETTSAPNAAPVLRIGGVGLQSLSLSAADLTALPRTTLAVTEREGEKMTYEGVSLQTILSKAGMAFGQALRGPRLRDYLLAESPDKFGVVFALPEISEEFSDRRIMVADRVNGAPITGRDGPLRIIVSDEKKHARWVRNVTSLTVQTAAPESPTTK